MLVLKFKTWDLLSMGIENFQIYHNKIGTTFYVSNFVKMSCLNVLWEMQFLKCTAKPSKKWANPGLFCLF